jgi:hypothetical protein
MVMTILPRSREPFCLGQTNCQYNQFCLRCQPVERNELTAKNVSGYPSATSLADAGLPEELRPGHRVCQIGRVANLTMNDRGCPSQTMDV